jgi:hypothetical protein
MKTVWFEDWENGMGWVPRSTFNYGINRAVEQAQKIYAQDPESIDAPRVLLVQAPGQDEPSERFQAVEFRIKRIGVKLEEIRHDDLEVAG